MTVLAGSYDGYDVIAPCNQWGLVGVRGRGERRTTSDDELGQLRQRVRQAVGPLVVGVGYGMGCRQGQIGLTVYVRRYGDVDRTVAALGRLLRDAKLGDEFVVLLQPTAWQDIAMRERPVSLRSSR
jgi:hypothetical protein